MPTATVLQFHVWLIDSDPAIWRRFQISHLATLNDLHHVLQGVMGWQNSHLHAFDIGGDRYAPSSPMPLEQTIDSKSQTLANLSLPKETQLIYTYDFGDGWMHLLTVEARLPATDQTALPICLAGERACPPEDCGGVWGYSELLERLDDPDDPEYEDLLDWIGVDFDPNAFSVEAVNQRLRALQ